MNTIRAGSAVIAATVEMIAFAVWFGGIVIVGAVVAPIAFHVVTSAPEMAGTLDGGRHLAGAIVGGSLRVYNIAAIVGGIVMLVAAVRLFRAGAAAKPVAVHAALTALALAGTLVLQFGLFPAMDRLREGNLTSEFDRLHSIYETISEIQLGILVAVAAAYCTALRSISNAVYNRTSTVESESNQ
jgi:hypothetical protein